MSLITDLATFNKQKEILNEGQRAAVENIEGPSMVLAGAGAGKTQVLSLRIGEIMAEADVSPNNILCLTFTESGRVAMRKRLTRMFGSIANKVYIFTFHSFCAKVIQENTDYIELRDFTTATEFDILLVIRELLDGLDNTNPLYKYSGQFYYHEKPLKALFQLMKMEGFDYPHVKQKAEEYINGLPDDPDYQYKRKYKAKDGTVHQVGDPKTSLIEGEKERMDKLVAGAALFDKYNELLRDKKIYDFADMLRYVNDAFEAKPFLLRRYQEQFLYVLVDEFQDTSKLQFDILYHLVNYWESPNVFLVGDDSQMIFRFQGARLKNMTEFAYKYPETNLISLPMNYRSTPQIVELTNQFIQKNEQRLDNILGVDKEITAYKAGGPRPIIRRYNNIYEELADIWTYLKTCRHPLNEMAIIFKKHKQVELLMKALDSEGIPYQAKKPVNILTTPEIKSFITIIKYFQREARLKYSGEGLLYEIIRYDYTPITFETFQQIIQELAHLNNKRVKEGKLKLKLSEYITGPDIEVTDQIEEFRSFLLNGHFRNLSVPDYFRFLAEKSGYLKAAMSRKDTTYVLALMQSLVNAVDDYCKKNRDHSVAAFIGLLNAMEENGVPINVERIYNNPNGVHLLSAHGSKGLEFKIVRMVDCGSDWEAKNLNQGQFKIPYTISLTSEQGDEEDARRAFFVAMSRAEHVLELGYSNFSTDGKEKLPSMFIEELKELGVPKIEEATPVFLNEFLRACNSFDTETVLKDTLIPEEQINSVLDDFVMSVSAFNAYRECPIRFYYEYILKVPFADPHFFEFGLMIHNALELWYLDMSRRKTKRFGTMKSLLKHYMNQLDERSYKFPKNEIKFYRDRGLKALEFTFEHMKRTTASRVEQRISNVLIGDVPVKGFIDKMEFQSELEVILCDYKTGKYDKKKFEPYKGNYWYQGIIYYLMIFNQSLENWVPVDMKFQYVEPQRRKWKEVSIPWDAEDGRKVKLELKQAWDDIHDHKFHTGCGDDNCRWCNFQKTL